MTPPFTMSDKHLVFAPPGDEVTLRLPFRTPMDAPALFAFLAARSVRGIEERVGESYRRTLKLPHSPGIVELEPGANFVWCRLRLGDVRDLAVAVCRCRLLLDLDADPVAINSALGGDPLLGPLVRRSPGLRVPGTVDGAELAVRAVIGQQISVAGARTIAGRLVAGFGSPLAAPSGGLTHVWPDVEVLVGSRSRKDWVSAEASSNDQVAVNGVGCG